jgi:hypothetical protein
VIIVLDRVFRSTKPLLPCVDREIFSLVIQEYLVLD